MRSLKTMDAACAVLALHYVSGVDEKTALRVCVLSGFHPGEGMSDDEWREAADMLGVQVRAFPVHPCRLHQFITAHKSGLFLVATPGHLFVVDNGLLVDPRMPSPMPYRRVSSAWRVTRVPA